MAEPLGGSPIGPYGAGGVEPGGFTPKEPVAPEASFVDLLKKSVNEVNNLQAAADDKVQKLVTGEISSIHEVMIASEEAGIAFNLLLQIRNQLLQAWNEMKRTPI